MMIMMRNISTGVFEPMMCHDQSHYCCLRYSVKVLHHLFTVSMYVALAFYALVVEFLAIDASARSIRSTFRLSVISSFLLSVTGCAKTVRDIVLVTMGS